LDPGNLPYIIRAIEDRLLQHPELGLYQRGGRITRIHEDTWLRPDETVTTVLVIDEAEKYELLLDVTSVASFDRHERADIIPADPTTVHINTLMGLKYRSRLRRLTGVIESPLLLPTGRLIEKHGYDEATGFFFDTGSVEFPRIPEQPNKPECLAALTFLDDDLLSNFPFVDDASRSVALSALLTVIARPGLIGLAPMHAYSAPEAGTGKSYLADLVVLLATGRFAAAINAGKDEEELEKRLDGLLLKSINNVVISNIYDAIESAKLSDMLSRRRLHVRMLGGNSAKHMRTIENSAFVQATGNNLKIEAGLSSTPSRVTFRSVRGSRTR
jgi:hypothetical protein